VTDGHDGLLAAIKELFGATPRQRCLLHKQRNVLNAIPRRASGGPERTAGHLGSAHQAERLDTVDRLQSQIWPTVPRGRQEFGRGGRQDVDLIMVPETCDTMERNVA